MVKYFGNWLPIGLAILAIIAALLPLFWVLRAKRKSVRLFIEYLHRRILHDQQNSAAGPARDCRVSVLVPKGWFRRRLIILCRSDGQRSKKKWATDVNSKKPPSGLAGISFSRALELTLPENDSELPDVADWDIASKEDKQRYCDLTNITENVAKNLTWRAMAYRVIPIRGPNQEPCAVVMFESKTPDGLGGQRVGGRERLSTDALYIAQLLFHN